jgi:hypothetical protein
LAQGRVGVCVRGHATRDAMTGKIVGALALGAWLALAGPVAAAQTRSGPDQVVDGAKRAGQGVEETAKGIGQTVTDGARKVGSRAREAGEGGKAVGDNLHDAAKGFGEALWDGMRYVGRTIENFFTGKK